MGDSHNASPCTIVSAWQILIGNIVRQITDRGELVAGGGRHTVIEDGEVLRGHLASA